MMPHRYHSTEPNGGRSAVEIEDGKRISIQALKLHNKHCVMPFTGPNCKLDIAYPMVRGKVRRVGQPRTHWVGTRMGDIVGSLSCDVTVETLAVTDRETDQAEPQLLPQRRRACLDWCTAVTTHIRHAVCCGWHLMLQND